MAKKTRTRRNKSVGGKKRKENFVKKYLRKSLGKSVKKVTNVPKTFIKNINLFNILKKTKKRKHKGGG